MKRANIVLDNKLVKDCMKATGIKTRRALIDHTLREILRHEAQTAILELKGNSCAQKGSEYDCRWLCDEKRFS